MRIKRIIRAALIIFLICFTIIIVLSNSKHIWKLFGYTLCEKVDRIQIYSIFRDYNCQTIRIQGTAENSEGFYSGYSFNIKEGNLYIGLKYNKYYGYESKTKDFVLEIPCKVYDIKSIYLVDGTNERKI